MSDFDELTAPEFPLEEVADIPSTELSNVSPPQKPRNL